MNPTELRRLAADLSVEAGNLAIASRDLSMSVFTKSSATDLVTEHDRAAEALLVDRIRAERPDDAIVGEEGASQAGASGHTWYLDPIDGTTNFVYGHPMWSTSVAVADGEGTVAGAVFAPATGELFTAARGEGATLGDAAIHASAITELRLALVATGFGYAPDVRHAQAARLAGFISSIRDIRRGGSAALDLCYVAAGRVDGYFESGVNIWDIAAGELIARESGCRTSWIDGGSDTTRRICAAPPAIFNALRDLAELD